MALTFDEQQALSELKQNGYSFTEAMSFIGGQRFNKPSTVASSLLDEDSETGPTGFKAAISDIPNDLKGIGAGLSDAVRGGRDDAADAYGQVFDQEISEYAGAAKTIGAGLSAGAKAVGSVATGILKLPFSQTTEDAVSEKVEAGTEAVIGTDAVQSLISKYENLSPEAKANVDGALGTVEGLATMLGAGTVSNSVRSSIGKVGSISRDAAKKLDNVNLELKGVSLPGPAGITEAVDLGMKPSALMQKVARIPKGKQTKFEELAGESVGTYLVERQIFGTPDQIVDQLVERLNKSRGRIDERLAQIEGTSKKPVIKTALDDLIERDTRVSTIGAKSADSDRITELYKQHQTSGLTLSEINEVKRLYERNVRVDYLNSLSSSPEKLVRATNIDSSLRTLVEDEAAKRGFDIVKNLNKETQLAKQLADDLGAEYAGSAGNNSVSLTDWILLAEAANSPTAAVAFGVKKTMGSKNAMSAVAKLMAKNSGAKAELPDAKVTNQAPINGYLEFLERQE